MTTKSDYVIYLDTNGMVIYVDEQEFDASQYAYVLYTQSSNSRFGKDQVQLVMSDGSVKTVDTDDDYTSLEGTIVYYRADDKGEYALRQPPMFTRTVPLLQPRMTEPIRSLLTAF